ncbi:MAG: hypothetical protein H0W50_04710 [Parachlamydiaceae bacterium]|nr:hypothetical protein [Parachlamydiaceae bacterium]
MARTINEKIKDSLFYKAPVAISSNCKKLFETASGLSKVAGVALSIFTLIDLKIIGFSTETINILSEQARTIQTINGGTIWASTTTDLLTKPFNDGWIGNIKRIAGIASSILSVNNYLNKIHAPNFTHHLITIGGISISQILSIFTITLSLIQNGLTFYENYNNTTKLSHKRIALTKSHELATHEAKVKLAHRFNLIEEKYDANEVDNCRDQIDALEEEKALVKEHLNSIQYDEVIKGNKHTYTFKSVESKKQFDFLSKRLKELSQSQNKFQFALKVSFLRQKVLNLAYELGPNNTTAEVKQLNLALKLLENPGALALKEVKILIKREGAYVAYKKAKYAIREENLDIEFKETCWATAGNVVSFAIIALGLSKARFGVEAVMSLFNIQTKDCLKKIEAVASLIIGSIGIRKYLWGEVSKPEPRPADVLNFYTRSRVYTNVPKKKLTLLDLVRVEGEDDSYMLFSNNMPLGNLLLLENSEEI